MVDEIIKELQYEGLVAVGILGWTWAVAILVTGLTSSGINPIYSSTSTFSSAIVMSNVWILWGWKLRVITDDEDNDEVYGFETDSEH
jgi:hypothetical protein